MVRAQQQNYIPAQGDLVWLEFDPQAGHEQAERRPAIIISPKEYNKKTGLALVCPITSKIKNYPFEVLLPNSHAITGAILSDQIKNLDWKIRKATYVTKANEEVMQEVIAKIYAIISL